MYIVYHPILGYYKGVFMKKWTDNIEEARRLSKSRANAFIKANPGAEIIKV